MEDCRPMATPMITDLKKVVTSDLELVDPKLYRHLIGSLMYLVNTQPNICFVVNSLSQFMVEPKKVHWVAVKHVLRYLRGIVEYGLKYFGGDGVRLQGYTDLDWAALMVSQNCQVCRHNSSHDFNRLYLCIIILNPHTFAINAHHIFSSSKNPLGFPFIHFIEFL
jgi:hypothetical protein